MRYQARYFGVAGVALLVAACGGGGGGKGPLSPDQISGKKTKSGDMVVKAAAEGFEKALKKFAATDKAGEWSQSDCTGTADTFMAAAKEQKDATGKDFPEAIYNAGLAYQRCGMDAKALAQFNAAKAADANFHRARAQLALYGYSKGGDLDSTIRDLEQIIRDAKFQNVEALVSLAALQMERANDKSDGDGANDLERAKKNIQRALAIDDSFMPAFNQLSIYYLELARKKAGSSEKATGRGKKRRRRLVVSGSKGTDVNRQQLDLAALVASQAIQKNPKYAPIHNTAGLIQVELKNYNGAVKSFGRARQLDPGFFEAHMNYAAVSLGFRGFSEAEKAYGAALKLKPDTFEAHLGIALAIRGQINPGNQAKIKEAGGHLEKAKKLEPDRPEPYYNEAILTQEFKAKGEEESAVPMLEKAADIYEDFVRKAGGDSAYAEAVKRSKDRVQDIRDTVQFIKDGKRLKAEEDARLKAISEKKKADAAAAAKNPPPPPPK